MNIGEIILGRRLAIYIQRNPFAVGDVYGNFRAENTVFEDGVDAFAHTAILMHRWRCFHESRHCFELIVAENSQCGH